MTASEVTEQFPTDFNVWWTLCIVRTVSHCCWSIYLNVGGLREGPGKSFWLSWEVLRKSRNFCQ